MAGDPRINGKEEKQHDRISDPRETNLKTMFREFPECASMVMNELFKTPNRKRADKRLLEFMMHATKLLENRTTKCSRILSHYAINFWFKRAVLEDRRDANLLLAQVVNSLQKSGCLTERTAIKLIEILLPED